MQENKALTKSRSDRRIAGVAGGLAEYFGIDATLVRILFVLLALSGGPGLLLYIVLALVMPDEPRNVEYVEKRKHEDYA